MGFLTHFESYQNINFSQFCDTLKYCAFYEGRTVYIINQVSQNYSIPLNFKITSTSNRLIPRSLIPTRDLAFESPWSGLSKNIYIVGGLRHERHATRPFLNFSNIYLKIQCFAIIWPCVPSKNTYLQHFFVCIQFDIFCHNFPQSCHTTLIFCCRYSLDFEDYFRYRCYGLLTSTKFLMDSRSKEKHHKKRFFPPNFTILWLDLLCFEVI